MKSRPPLRVGRNRLPSRGARQFIETFRARVEEALDDDFNAPQALGFFYELQTHLNTLVDLSKGYPESGYRLSARAGFCPFFNTGRDLRPLPRRPENLPGVGENAARKEKNWKRGDANRSELLTKGVLLEDTPSGTLWKTRYNLFGHPELVSGFRRTRLRSLYSPHRSLF
jgi:cysteinyl-tRNA synthetase